MTVTSTPLRAALAEATARLVAAGVPSARHDAESLAAHSLGVLRRDLWRHDEPGPGFAAYVGRRAAREPLQHITGTAPFRHLDLQVGPGVFVPRPETEVVVDAVLARLAVLPRAARPRVVDLGTGSGAIALAVATEVAGSDVHAVEADPGAHAWAARNCAGSRVDLRLGDMADAFAELDGTVDVVVSNPPYIPVDAVIRDPEVAAHDPALALWSGDDGLDAMHVVERVAARLLRPGGAVVVEHADVQGESAPAVFAGAGRWDDVRDHQDLAGRDRYLTAVRRAGAGVGGGAG
ncbi:MAG: peptide chain release factor N(5)-glutamine methyltransferase [Sporichthyaceae bacterium]